MMAARASRPSKGKKTPSRRNLSRVSKPKKSIPSRKAAAKPSRAKVRILRAKPFPRSRPSKAKSSSSKARQVKSWSKPNLRQAKARIKGPSAAPKLPKKEPKLSAELDAVLSNSRVRQMLVDSGGESALDIMRAFTKELSDDDLAKKLKLKISDVRATLNRLHNLGIVQYNRYKDAETGWFSYFWSLNLEKTKSWVEEQILKEAAPGDISSSEYYFCPKCGAESMYEFAAASDNSFRCPLCNKALEFVDENAAKDLFPRVPKRTI
jgi:transcription factor E